MERVAEGSAQTLRTSRSPAVRTVSTTIKPVPPARSLERGLLVLVVLGVIWRVARYAACPPLWGDEAFLAVSILRRGYAGMLRPLEYYQIAPVGFLWAERAVFQAFGASEWSLRLIPFLSGLISLGLFVRLARKTLDLRTALVAVGIFACSYYPVRHAVEVKPYATDLLFSILATGLAWSLWLDRTSIRRWLALAGVIGVGVWCSYPLVFVATGLGFILGYGVWLDFDRRTLGLWLTFGVVIGSSWLAFYFVVARPQSAAAPFYTELGTWQGAFPPWQEPWKLAYWLFDVHTGNMLAYPIGGNNFGSLPVALLVIAGGLSLWKTSRAFLAMLLAPLAFTFLASVAHRYPYGTSARTSLYMAPAFCLLAGIGFVSSLQAFNARRRRNLYGIASAALAGGMLGATFLNVALPYKNYEDGENRRAVSDLARLSKPGDRWIVYDGVQTLPLSRGLMLEHWLQQMAEVRYNVLAKANVPVTWMPEAGEFLTASEGRTWLIVHRSGCPRFDELRLNRLKVELASRLGPPKERVDRLTRRESIEALEYPRSEFSVLIR